MYARLTAFALVALLAAGVGDAALAAESPGRDAEVRVVARRLADARVEFALQQHRTDGTWGERLLPRARFFPTTATLGRWLASTPLAVQPSRGAEAEVRIVARRLADARVEVALQHRAADGTWGERLLPQARFFPPTADVGRWLASTPLTVPGTEPEVAPSAPPGAVPAGAVVSLCAGWGGGRSSL